MNRHSPSSLISLASLSSVILLAAILLLGGIACGDDDGTDAGSPDANVDADLDEDRGVDLDAEVDAGPDAPRSMCDTPVAFAAGTAPEAVVLGGDGLTVGQLTAGQLPEDTLGLATWREGDFVISNGRIGAIVSQLSTPGQTYDPNGGRIVGLARVDGDRLVDAADYSLIMMTLGRFLVETETVSIISDGSDGGPAVIRATGPLAPMLSLGTLIETLAPHDYTGGQAALDYSLAADSDIITITLRIRAAAPRISSIGALQVFFQARRMPPWRPGVGFMDPTDPAPFIAFSDDNTVNYAWLAPEGTALMPLLSVSGADIFNTGLFRLGCEEATLELGRIAVGSSPGLPALQATLAPMRMPAVSLRNVSGTVTGAGGDLERMLRVHVTTEDGEHLTRFVPEADGSFDISVDDRAANYWLWQPGFPVAGPFPVEESVVLSMPAAALIQINADELPAITAMPITVEVFPMTGDAPAAPGSFGENTPGAGRVILAHPPTGEMTIALAPGDYRVRIGRGPFYDRFETDLSLAVGDDIPLDVLLGRVSPNPGVLCGDFHLHSHRSVDSSDRADDKVRALAGEGVEIALRTEHEYVADYAPNVAEAGLEDFMLGLGGEEMTTVEYGHFNVFPLTPDPTAPSDGAPLWPGNTPHELMELVRARSEAPTIIVNHPRDGGAIQAYFNAAGFDPVTGTVAHPELWDEEFNVVEVFNDSNFESSREETVRDWFALLNQGRRIAAVGSSDNHRLASGPVGYPRTCLRISDSDITPPEVTARMVQSALEGGHSVIAGGIDLRIQGPAGEGPGDTVMDAGSEVIFHVTLAAAEHVETTGLEIIIDGETVEMRDITTTGRGARFDENIAIPVDAGGSWVVFHAFGETGYNTAGSIPFAVSNPIFLSR